MAVWRFNSDGSLDNTFGGDGIIVHNNAAGGNDFDEGNAIALDSTGKILVTGYSDNGTNYDMAVWRFNSDGSLDNTFGGDGIVVHNNAAGGNGSDGGNGIALDSTDKILVTGYSGNSTDTDMVVWRFNSNGSFDSTFGGDGIVVHNNAAGGNSHDLGKAIEIYSNGKILVCGDSYNELDSDMTIWRYR